MSEWWTYSLADFLLFSPQTYYRLFERYNLALWPLQVASLVLGIAIPIALTRGGIRGSRMAWAILAIAWLWVAVAFFLQRYATINWIASYFAAGFGIEAVLLAGAGVTGRRLRLPPANRGIERAGLGIFLLALVAYPLIAPVLGRPWGQAEIFGMTPDPTAMATLGILLLASPRPSWLLLVIPTLWCAVSGATLWAMKSPEAWLLSLAAILTLSLSLGKMLRQSGNRLRDDL